MRFKILLTSTFGSGTTSSWQLQTATWSASRFNHDNHRLRRWCNCDSPGWCLRDSAGTNSSTLRWHQLEPVLRYRWTLPNLQLIIPFGIISGSSQAPSRGAFLFSFVPRPSPYGCLPDSSPINGVAAWEQLFYDGDRLRSEVKLLGRCSRGPSAVL